MASLEGGEGDVSLSPELSASPLVMDSQRRRQIAEERVSPRGLVDAVVSSMDENEEAGEGRLVQKRLFASTMQSDEVRGIARDALAGVPEARGAGFARKKPLGITSLDLATDSDAEADEKQRFYQRVAERQQQGDAEPQELQQATAPPPRQGSSTQASSAAASNALVSTSGSGAEAGAAGKTQARSAFARGWPYNSSAPRPAQPVATDRRSATSPQNVPRAPAAAESARPRGSAFRSPSPRPARTGPDGQATPASADLQAAFDSLQVRIHRSHTNRGVSP